MSDNVLDLPEFLERVQDDKELLLELLDIFTEDYKVKRELLAQAIQSSNFEQIRSIAHSLKGASGNISAKVLRVVMLRIEEKGKVNQIDGLNDLLGQMDVNYNQLANRIVTVKQELNG